jgi:aspartate aminotransferase
MCEALRSAKEGDVVVVQGSCHNPCGADLTQAQWAQLIQLFQNHRLVPLIDIAYHGLAAELDEDACGWRSLVNQMPEALLAYSCSKSFGIYRERTGALISVSANGELASVTLSNMLTVVREIYSVPPAHGAYIVAEILDDNQLREQWLMELERMRNRIFSMRALLAEALNSRCEKDYSFIVREKGMFSYLGLDAAQIEQMRRDFSVYVVNSSRISVAGVTERNVDYIAEAVAAATSSK